MKAVARWLALLLCAALVLQVFFVLRIAAMAWVDPQSTSVQRSQAWQLLRGDQPWQMRQQWRQQWRPYVQISSHLKRAVVAAEDDGFSNHEGIEWNAMEQAWKRNNRAQTQAEQSNKPVRLRGGSTITQQLAKNLLLSGERSLLRKGQELLLTLALEQFLSKQRILEIYLNNVEWGEGVFGAEAAAQRYFGVSAAQLSAPQAARLAVMLPAPKRFERNPSSAYLNQRTRTILARMPQAQLP